jgi:hypothetical protein
MPGPVEDGARKETIMVNATVNELGKQNEAAWDDLGRQLHGMDAHLGTDEITLPIFIGAMFGRHWSGHAGQLASIRRAAGLPEAK